MTGGEKVVSVTGASGYIASWVVKLLLQRGYLVKATVRDPNDATKTDHLLAMDGAKERLQLFKADLMEEGSFDSAAEGSECVFHTASPINLSPQDPQAELVDPAVKGTLNVLRSCAKYSVKRVVLTSSMSAVVFSDRYVGGVTVDETWFSDPAFCEQSKLWYMLSKTLAEEAAWKFSKDKGIDLVTINPGLVIGPLLQPTLNVSVKVIVDIIKGVRRLVNSHRYVDVRDVAFAHVQAFEIASASGRYCLVERVAHRSEALKIIHQLYPSLKSLTQCRCENVEPFLAPTISKAKATSLGVSFIPLEVSLRDTLESLKLKGFLIF